MYKLQKIITEKTGKQTFIYIEGPDPMTVMDLYHEATVDYEEIPENYEEQEEEEIECPHCGSSNMQDITKDSNKGPYKKSYYCLDCKKQSHE